MTLTDIYQEYKAGSQGFCVAVETHCDFGISRDEIERIADVSDTADQFMNVWGNTNWWFDNA